MRKRTRLIVALGAGILAATAALACHDEATTGPEITTVQFAKRTVQDPEVTAADPPSAPQDTTLDVEVSGSGFDSGSTVALTLAGVPTEKVLTNSTRYRNSRTLIANITIAADAEVDLYDVEVMTARGKRGIGTEMFEVTATQIVTFTFRDGSDLITGDGRIMDASQRTTYTSDECGVNSWIAKFGNANLRTQRYPIKQQESGACGGKEGRVLRVSFTDRVDAGDALEWDEASMDGIMMLVYDILSIPLGATEPRKVEVAFDDQGGRGAGWGQACPWRLKFDSDWAGSTELQVTRLKDQQTYGYDEWTIDAAPDDVAVCLGGKSEPYVLGYYHVPFQVNVECRGPC
jgi:hypothetical protein